MVLPPAGGRTGSFPRATARTAGSARIGITAPTPEGQPELPKRAAKAPDADAIEGGYTLGGDELREGLEVDPVAVVVVELVGQSRGECGGKAAVVTRS